MVVRIANKDDVKYADELVLWYEESARQRKTGIAKRNPVYLQRKMVNGNAIIAFDDDGSLAGFSYIETYEEEKFVVNSGSVSYTHLTLPTTPYV